MNRKLLAGILLLLLFFVTAGTAGYGATGATPSLSVGSEVVLQVQPIPPPNPPPCVPPNLPKNLSGGIGNASQSHVQGECQLGRTEWKDTCIDFRLGH
jgi:hypothetical protein